MRGNVTVPSSFQFTMSPPTSVGTGYLHSKMNRSRTTTCAGNIITRLTSRSLTGHTLPIHAHQHYDLEFHLVLTKKACIRRGCWRATLALRLCTQLERVLEGLRSCVCDDKRELPLPDMVEPCFRALPLHDLIRSPCDCELCKSAALIRWLRKIRQWALNDQTDICSYRSSHLEMLD